MMKIISQITFPSALLYIFLVITQIIAGIYLSRGIQLPPIYTLLNSLAFFWITSWWLQEDSRKRNINWILDMGLFLYVAWIFVMPYYLFKTRGVKAFPTILAFAGIYLGAFFVGAIIYILLTP